MASAIRTVRRQFRKELLMELASGEKHLSELVEIAGRLFGHEVGYETLIKAFLAGEVAKALSLLRLDGEAESVGKVWKKTESLTGDDVDILSLRRFKRVRGELKAEVALAHAYGRVEDAITASQMLAIVTQKLHTEEAKQEVVAEMPG